MEENLKCNICPRKCNVDRNIEIGLCGMQNEIRIGRIAPHYWEEPSISGEKGSGAVFFAGCNLKCVYCQNYRLSRGRVGQVYTKEQLIREMLDLQQRGVHNINLVTPSHYLEQVAEVLKEAKDKGLTIPIVYNSSGYEKADSLKRLEGLIDIYMPDFKYFHSETAAEYSKAKDYPEVVKRALKEMYRQVGAAVFDEHERMNRGMLVRHLVLPGCLEESKNILKYLYDTFGDAIYISIMNQYTPVGDLKGYPQLQRTLTQQEYDEVVEYAVDIGIEHGYIQEGETAKESFIPEFK